MNPLRLPHCPYLRVEWDALRIARGLSESDLLGIWRLRWRQARERGFSTPTIRDNRLDNPFMSAQAREILIADLESVQQNRAAGTHRRYRGAGPVTSSDQRKERMSWKPTFSCDICGKPRAEVNDWFVVREIRSPAGDVIRVEILHFDDVANPEHDDHKHVCGDGCGLKMVTRFFQSGTIEKETQAA